MGKILIAVPRGRILEECKQLLNKCSFAPDSDIFNESSRKLTFSSKNKDIDFIKVRAFDACTFVAFGAAQLGIAGEDVIREFNYSEIYAPINLNIGHCRLSVAALSSLLKSKVSRPNFSILNELDKLEPSDSLFMTVSDVTILSLSWIDKTSIGGVERFSEDIFSETSFSIACARVGRTSDLGILITSFFFGFNSSSVSQT